MLRMTGRLPGEFLWIGRIDECGDRCAVEALELDQPGFDERARVQAAGFAFGPAFDFAALDVEGVDVGGDLAEVMLKARSWLFSCHERFVGMPREASGPSVPCRCARP